MAKSAELTLAIRYGLMVGDTFVDTDNEKWRIVEAINPMQDAERVIEQYQIASAQATRKADVPRYIIRKSALDNRIVSIRRLGMMLNKTITPDRPCLVDWSASWDDFKTLVNHGTRL